MLHEPKPLLFTDRAATCLHAVLELRPAHQPSLTLQSQLSEASSDRPN